MSKLEIALPMGFLDSEMNDDMKTLSMKICQIHMYLL